MTQQFHDELAAISNAIADKTRIKILCLLMDGRAYTATELSIAADVTPSTASVHLSKLVKQQLVECVAQGRYRYFRLFSPEVAYHLESLMTLIPSSNHTSKIPNRVPETLKLSRTCYDHMAGKVAVNMLSFMLKNGWLTGKSEYQLTEYGEKKFVHIGVNLTEISMNKSSKKFACACLDWSERQEHLAGLLGKALLETALAKKWFNRHLQSRELMITPSGKKALFSHFNVCCWNE